MDGVGFLRYELLAESQASPPRSRPWARAAAVGAALSLGLVALATVQPQGWTGRHDDVAADAGSSPAGITDLDASVQAKKEQPKQRGPPAAFHPTVQQNAKAKGSSNSSTRLRPVVFFHGAAQSAEAFDPMRRWIERRHPGTPTLSIDAFSGTESFTPLEEQVRTLFAYLTRLVEEHPKEFGPGYNLVCHSQGALACRVAVQVMDGHRVLSFVSLAGPQMGVYGTTWLESAQPFLQDKLPMPMLPPFIPGPLMKVGAGVLAGSFYSLAYGSLQNSTSLANLWHDPLHVKEYLKGNVFLPRVNGEVELVKQAKRENFVRLQRATFLVGAFERKYDSKLGLEPWQTGVFGFYKDGSDREILPMEEQEVFKKDTFGLRTLHDAGKLHVLAVPGVEHQQWLTSEAVFERFILPHLSA